MAPNIVEKIKLSIANRERYFQRVQAAFDLIKVPAKRADFLARCQLIDDAYAKFESHTELINQLNTQLDDETQSVDTLSGSKAFDEIYYAVKAHEAKLHAEKLVPQPHQIVNVQATSTPLKVKLPQLTFQYLMAVLVSFYRGKACTMS